MKSSSVEPLAPLSKTGVPSEDDVREARTSSHILAKFAARQAPVRFQLADNGSTEKIVIPAAAVPLLLNMLSEMARGNAVLMIPFQAELTTQQAASLLNVSRPFFIRILEDGKIPFRKVGTHRRVMAKDVLEFKQKIDVERQKTLDELAEQAQDLGMGY